MPAPATSPKAPCPSSADTRLFGVVLECATRDELRRAVAAAGGRPQRESDDYWVDIYDSAALLDESAHVQLMFVDKTREFARATYEFPGQMDTGLIERVAKRVSSKYGPPTRKSGRPDLGPMSYGWTLRDGIELTVRRGWPDTTTFLEYINPPQLRACEREMAAERQRRETERNQAQNASF